MSLNAWQPTSMVLDSKVPLAKHNFEWTSELSSPDKSTKWTTLEFHCNNGDYYSVAVAFRLVMPRMVKIATFFKRNVEKLSWDCTLHGISESGSRLDTISFDSLPLLGKDSSSLENGQSFNIGRDIAQGITSLNIFFTVEILPLEHKPVDLTSTVSQAIGDLYRTGEGSDITLICEGEEFQCHRFVLSLRSNVFKTMFASRCKEETEQVINIEDIEAETMESFLKFMYTDSINMEKLDCNLLIAADRYNFKRLANVCLRHLLRTLNTENVMEITVTAYLLNNDVLLKEASKFIFNHRGNIKKCEQWDDIKARHPGIATKVMDLIVFRDSQ